MNKIITTFENQGYVRHDNGITFSEQVCNMVDKYFISKQLHHRTTNQSKRCAFLSILFAIAHITGTTVDKIIENFFAHPNRHYDSQNIIENIKIIFCEDIFMDLGHAVHILFESTILSEYDKNLYSLNFFIENFCRNKPTIQYGPQPVIQNEYKHNFKGQIPLYVICTSEVIDGNTWGGHFTNLIKPQVEQNNYYDNLEEQIEIFKLFEAQKEQKEREEKEFRERETYRQNMEYIMSIIDDNEFVHQQEILNQCNNYVNL